MAVPFSVRNIAFAQGHISAAGSYTVYAVPDGHNLILKSAVLFPTTAAQGVIELDLVVNTVAVVMVITHVAVTTQFGNNWDGWVVLNATDQLAIATDLAGVNYSLSGALLPNTGQAFSGNQVAALPARVESPDTTRGLPAPYPVSVPWPQLTTQR